MLHSTIVSSEYAEETSTKAVRHRGTQVLPKGSYSFGDAEMLPGSCMTIQPKPVKQVIQVHQSAVAPNSLPGGALPRDTAVMPTGEMRGLGESLASVPMAFRHGVAASKRSILGDKNVRRVGSSLVAMAPMAADYERNPISQDRPYLNRSGGTGVLPNYGMAPDDRIRQKLFTPSTPGPTISREPMPMYEAPGRVMDSRARYESTSFSPQDGQHYARPSVHDRRIALPRQDSRVSRYRSIRGADDSPSMVLANSIASGVSLGIGVAVLGVAAAGIYWFTRS